MKHLESLGFTAKIVPHALNRHGFVSDTAENKNGNLQEMWSAQMSGPSLLRLWAIIHATVGCQRNWTLLRPRKPKRLGVVEAPSEG